MIGYPVLQILCRHVFPEEPLQQALWQPQCTELLHQRRHWGVPATLLGCDPRHDSSDRTACRLLGGREQPMCRLCSTAVCWRNTPRKVAQPGPVTQTSAAARAHTRLGMYCRYMGAGPMPTGLSSGTAGSSSLSAARGSRCSSRHPVLAAAWCSDQAGIAGQAAPAAAACSIRGNGRSGGGGRGGLYQLLAVSGHACAASIPTLQLASHLAACTPTG